MSEIDLATEGSAVNTNGPRDEFTGPYNPNSTREDLEATHGANNVTSTTSPNNPVQTANSNPDKGIEVIHGADGGKAVRVQYNDRGLPIFDDYAKYTTNIDHFVSYKTQMKRVTEDLRDAINDGRVDSDQFTREHANKSLSMRQSGFR